MSYQPVLLQCCIVFLCDMYDNPKVLVLLWSWSLCANSWAVKTSDLVLYSHYLSYTKLYTKAKHWLISQPIAIVMEIDWAMKRNTSVVDDWYI